MELNAEQKCFLWLSSAEVAAADVWKLLDVFGSAKGIWDAFGQPNGFNPRGEVTRSVLASLHSETAMDAIVQNVKEKKIHLLFHSDEAYPDSLRSLSDPPYLLYYAGHLECLYQPCVGIVGTRRASMYGTDVATMLGRELASAGVCVVSGAARGIDAAAHRGALSASGATIAVLGSGLCVPYPAEHAPMLRQIASGTGLVLSEFPLDALPKQHHFPYRNRLISGLSLGVVLVEGRLKSGGMHTVNAALDQGREVFAVPGPIGKWGSEAPLALLREGARVVSCCADILEDLGLHTPEDDTGEQTDVQLTPFQRSILDALAHETMSVDDLSEALCCAEADVISELGTLEILGMIQREAGNRFRLSLSR